MEDWKNQIELYLKHISSFGFQPYLNILNISKFRYSMTKLRVSSHRLSIESSRWSKPNPTPLSERNCLFCNLLEDEYHFVLECNLYNALRKLYIPYYYRTRPNMLQMYELINAGNIKVLDLLGCRKINLLKLTIIRVMVE